MRIFGKQEVQDLRDDLSDALERCSFKGSIMTRMDDLLARVASLESRNWVRIHGFDGFDQQAAVPSDQDLLDSYYESVK